MSSPSPPLPRLAPRAADSHKGTFGRALLIGGSRGMAGSISLAGMATLRSGAGLTTLAVPESILDTVAGFEPSYMTLPLPCDSAGRLILAAEQDLLAAAEKATCVALGPGLGRSPELDLLVRKLYVSLPVPLVCDADGLNALAGELEKLGKPAGPRILTPHPGEFRRLAGPGASPAPSDDAAVKLAGNMQIIVVLKGHETLVSDGTRIYRNTTGNPGMATGGSGDVLTGVITALICQGLAPFEAAQLGVYLHGLAGDLAAKEVGQVGLIASDLVRYLPAAFDSLEVKKSSGLGFVTKGND